MLSVLADLPAVRHEELLAHRNRLVLVRRTHGVVPPIDESEVSHARGYLYDLILAPVLAHIGEHFVGDAVGNRSGGEREIERDALRFGEERARAVLPDGCKPALFDPEMQRSARR